MKNLEKVPLLLSLVIFNKIDIFRYNFDIIHLKFYIYVIDLGVYAAMDFKEDELVLKDQMLVGTQHSFNKVLVFVLVIAILKLFVSLSYFLLCSAD